MKLDVIIHNWRCFGSKQISIPLGSFALIDKNGSGKTSILSAVYTLFSAKPWPGTKYVDFLTDGQQYLGLLTPYLNWSFSGQIGKTGRLSTSTKKGKNNPIFSEDTQWPKIFTYLPSDNDWFGLSRSNKLKILDNLIGQIDDEYLNLVKNLENAVKAKNKYIKYCLENNISGDSVMVGNLSENVLETSKPVWKFRKNFLDNLASALPEFETWIESPIRNWSVEYKISDFGGFKREYDIVIPELERGLDFQKLWAKEMIIGKCFFGAQRDEFDITKSKSCVSKVLSRGEMRLLVLFIKNVAREIVNQNNPNSPVWWLLDDVFNELDEKREKIFYERVLANTDFYIITGTKKLHLPISSYKVKDLASEI